MSGKCPTNGLWVGDMMTDKKIIRKSLAYTCALGILITIIIKQSGAHLGKNSQYFYYGNNVVDASTAIIIFSLIFGTMAMVISYLISTILRTELIKKIIDEYPEDKIIFKYHPTIIAVSLAQFAIGGGFFGGYIVPFFVFDRVLHLDMVTTQNLPLYSLYAAIAFLICIIWETYTLFLTDKRIISIARGGSIVISKTVLPISHIKTIKKVFGGWEIISKDNNKLPIKFHFCAKKFQAKLQAILKNGEYINE